jgi:hypothetical protein
MKALAAPVVSSSSRKRSKVSRISVFVELTQTLISSGRWWLVPMVAVLALSAVLLGAVAAIEYVAPFVYTIF